MDRAYVDRVVALAEAVAKACHVTFKMFILALDHWYELDGRYIPLLHLCSLLKTTTSHNTLYTM